MIMDFVSVHTQGMTPPVLRVITCHKKQYYYEDTDT